MNFNDKVVIVTGSSSGIGAAIAIEFSALGANVCLVGRNQKKLDEVAKKCNNPLVLVADVTQDKDIQRIVNETVRYFGKLDILVNNAGMGSSASIKSETAMAVFDKIMNTNLRSVVYLTHLAAPHIIKTKGNIINISSVLGLRVLMADSFAYNTSKAGLDHFTRSVAAELASDGVRVNSVNPGPVFTDILENSGANEAIQKAIFDKMKQGTALNRISEPSEIADLVIFLASDKARAITGSVYVSDNGYLIKTA
ncbi:17-beta-hydroxysteroid dehydrogenase 14-like [Trichoplusia ni]|uniref:17-beta-hydroxysteroid dehydrogenase 14-like n=1 Tax=Trichoplusia ni TaxID=7111 RepID=A0A7E5VA43_TRINI|nr:17-beta-hydroxysteroid dehydrogenase 14-like [Trichoplusia ni]